KISASALAVHTHGFSVSAKPHGTAGVVWIGRFVAGPKIVREAVEGGVHQRAVETFVEVEDDEFPVGFDIVDDPAVEPQVLHAPGSELLRQLAELPRQRLGP